MKEEPKGAPEAPPPATVRRREPGGLGRPHGPVPDFEERTADPPPAEPGEAVGPVAASPTPTEAVEVVAASPAPAEAVAASRSLAEVVAVSLAVAAPEPSPAEAGVPEGQASVAMTLELPAEVREAMRVLPFRSPTPPAPEEEALHRTLEVPVLNPHLGQTATLGDNSIVKAVAALPFVGSTVGMGIVPFPRLSLEQYASLRGELLVWPERAAKILLRYHVMNEAAHKALDKHWEVQLAASPEVRAAFEKAFTEYIAWLRAQRG